VAPQGSNKPAVEQRFQASEEAAWVAAAAQRVVGEKQRWKACQRYVEEMLAVLPLVMMLQRATGMEVTDGHQQEGYSWS